MYSTASDRAPPSSLRNKTGDYKIAKGALVFCCEHGTIGFHTPSEGGDTQAASATGTLSTTTDIISSGVTDSHTM